MKGLDRGVGRRSARHEVVDFVLSVIAGSVDVIGFLGLGTRSSPTLPPISRPLRQEPLQASTGGRRPAHHSGSPALRNPSSYRARSSARR